jgi:hypothetical protein
MTTHIHTFFKFGGHSIAKVFVDFVEFGNTAFLNFMIGSGQVITNVGDQTLTVRRIENFGPESSRLGIVVIVSGFVTV